MGSESARPFHGKRPLDAMYALLADGQGMERSELEDAVFESGAADGKKRKRSNVRISVDKNLALGNIVLKPDGLIYLAEKPKSTL